MNVLFSTSGQDAYVWQQCCRTSLLLGAYPQTPDGLRPGKADVSCPKGQLAERAQQSRL